jgi:hypothetical protein
MVEGAIVSHGPVPMRAVQVRVMESTTSGESTPRKSLDHGVWKSSALGVIPGDGTEVRRGNTYEQGESRRGEER